MGFTLNPITNIRHILEAFNPPAPPVNHALPAKPNPSPSVLPLLLQGAASNLGVGSSRLSPPQVPSFMSNPRPYKDKSGVAYQEHPNHPFYDLLEGNWRDINPSFQALPLNNQYYQGEYPLQQPILPIYRGVRR